jgi:hypothetical protein
MLKGLPTCKSGIQWWRNKKNADIILDKINEKILDNIDNAE